MMNGNALRVSLALSLAVCAAVSCGGNLAPDPHDNTSAAPTENAATKISGSTGVDNVAPDARAHPPSGASQAPSGSAELPPVTGSASCEIVPVRPSNAWSAPGCGVDAGPASSTFKGCSVDSDCTVVRIGNCTLSLPAFGIAKDKVDEFRQCFPFPPCVPPAPGPGMQVETYAEDGHGNFDGAVIHVTCDHREGCPAMCRSHIP
jgi:hypothetical protein